MARQPALPEKSRFDDESLKRASAVSFESIAMSPGTRR